MKKLIYFTVSITFCFIYSCNNNSYNYVNSILEIDTIIQKGSIFENYEMNSIKSHSFFVRNDSVLIAYYSNRVDSLFIYSVKDTIKLIKSKYLSLSRSKDLIVESLTFIGENSFIFKTEKSIFKYNSKINTIEKIVDWEDNYSVLTTKNSAKFSSIDSSLFFELIQWDVDENEEGILMSNLVLKYSLKDKSVNYLNIKPEYRVVKDPNYSQFYTLQNDKLIYSNSLSNNIQVYNIKTDDVSVRKLESLKSEEYISEANNVIDKATAEAIHNSIYGDIFTDKNQFLYRVMSKPLPQRNEEGYAYSISDKENLILKYNPEFELIDIINTDIKGVFTIDNIIHKDVIYGMYSSKDKIIINRLKIDYE